MHVGFSLLHLTFDVAHAVQLSLSLVVVVVVELLPLGDMLSPNGWFNAILAIVGTGG